MEVISQVRAHASKTANYVSAPMGAYPGHYRIMSVYYGDNINHYACIPICSAMIILIILTMIIFNVLCY